MDNPKSYRDAGVDIDLEARAISSLVAELSYRRRGRYPMLGGVGHFAGIVDFGDLALSLAVDGVGTKMRVADRLEDWTTVGIDCIAMNVNDLYVMNMEPVAFVDYIATDSLSIEKMSQIGKGLNEGAKQANIDIIGGETATLKGLVNGLDLAGTCLGVQLKEKIVTGEDIAPGDRIVGLPSSGIHSNGLTLARKLVDAGQAWDERLKGGKTLGRELLTPTRIYHEVLNVTATCMVHGMCHITGGGLLNFRRLTSHGFDFFDPLPPQEIFHWLQDAGDIPDEEMYRTFNMGMGYAFVVPAGEEEKLLSQLPGSKAVGEITENANIIIKGEKIS